MGPADAPPLVVFQGGNFLNPLTLARLAPLSERYRLLAPDRIAAAALLVPAGFVAPPIVPLLRRVVAPMLAYLARPSEARLTRAVRPMFGGQPDPVWMEAIGAVFDHVRLASMPAPATRAELHPFAAPTLVLAAELDPFFPGETVTRKAREVVPHTEVHVMSDEAHVLGPEALRAANARIVQLLDAVTEPAVRTA